MYRTNKLAGVPAVEKNCIEPGHKFFTSIPLRSKEIASRSSSSHIESSLGIRLFGREIQHVSASTLLNIPDEQQGYNSAYVLLSSPPVEGLLKKLQHGMYPQAVSHGNILTFTPAGFKQTLNVKFPDCRLAVCAKCKKNYKTRDMCRVRNGHTDPPWSTAYMCITLDDSCTDSEGKYIDGALTVRMVQWQPFCVKAAFDKKTPVCAACKKTNRTRTFCRERHDHRQLPWCTVYVVLSALDTTDPSTVVAAPSTLADGDEAHTEQEHEHEHEHEQEQGKNQNDTLEAEQLGTDAVESAFKIETPPPQEYTRNASTTETTGETDERTKQEGDEPKADILESKKNSDTARKISEEDGDDINDVDESRAFLAQVSYKSNTINWLELSELDSASAGAIAMSLVRPPDTALPGFGIRHPAMPMPMPLMDPTGVQPQYPYGMGYAVQPHAMTPQQQQQYFMQMQQQNHFAAWQAQYGQQPPLMMPMIPGAMPMLDAPVAASAEDTPSDEKPSVPATTTVGEAGAQKQSKDKDSSTVYPFGATVPVAPGVVTAQQQAQAHAQWQAHMMYHQQQFYHQQLQMQNQQAFPPLTIPQPTPVLPPSTVNTNVSLNDDDLEPAPVSAMVHNHEASISEDEESDKKRQRVEI
eukprot:scaffold194026_cov60-Attheya_sp.AAC.1